MIPPPDKSVTADRATELLRLHQDPELLTVVNVWDVVSARAVAATPGTKALATASHSIAATFGYPDGEQIPVDLMLEMVGRTSRAGTATPRRPSDGPSAWGWWAPTSRTR